MTKTSATLHDHGAPVDQSAENTVLLRIENNYSDGHESTSTHRIAPPKDLGDDALEGWWNEAVFALTGDGHGADHPRLSSNHGATILAGPVELLGQSYDWG